MQLSPTFKGVCSLLASVVVNILSIKVILGLPVVGSSRLLIVGVNYLAVGWVMWLGNREGYFKFRFPQRSKRWLLVWVLAIVSVLAALFLYPQYLSLPQMIITQSLAPWIAIWLAKDHHHEKDRSQLFYSLLPLSFLLGVAVLEWASLSIIHIVFFGISTAAFLVGQTCSRIVTRRSGTWLFLIPFNWIIGLILVGLGVVLGGFTPVSSEVLWVALIVLPLGLWLTQRGFIYGLQNTPPGLSSLAISSAVPFALILNSNQRMTVVHWVLVVGYCLASACVGRRKK